MTTGNPAIGTNQGVGQQPYTEEQSPRIVSSTLGGVQVDMASAGRIAAAQERLDASVVEAIQAPT